MNNLKNKRSAFTIIELVIVISILAMLMMLSYAPYIFYQNKLRVKIASKEIWQAIYDSKNLAIHWVDTWSWNLSIWLLFDNNNSEKNKLKIFSYPFSFTWSKVVVNENSDVKLYKTINLQKWVQIDNISWRNKVLFFYEAISWKLSIFSFNWSNKTKISDDKININISFKWSSKLKKSVEYETYNKIVDYK